MKNVLIVLAVFIFNCVCAQNKIAVIHYKVINAQTLSSIFVNDNGKTIYDDNSKKNEGTIVIKIVEPEKVSLTLNDDQSTTRFFWMHDGNYEMEIDATSKEIIFKNSKLNDSYKYFKRILDSVRIFEDPLFKEMRNTNTTEKERELFLSQIDSFENIAAKEQYKYLINNPDSYLAIDFIRFHLGANDFDKQKLKILFNSLPTDYKQYTTYNLCKEAFQINKTFNIGDTVNNILLKFSNNTIKSLSECLNNRYTYLDFWSSGCQSSRINHKSMVKHYKKLKDKINFVSISDDNEKSNWLASIKKDKIKWMNSCDFKGMLSPIKMQFNIKSMPTGILIDKNGVIIKNDFKKFDTNALNDSILK